MSEETESEDDRAAPGQVSASSADSSDERGKASMVTFLPDWLAKRGFRPIGTLIRHKAPVVGKKDLRRQ